MVKLQYAVLCDRVEDTEAGWNLINIRHGVAATGVYGGDATRPPAVPFSVSLVLTLIDGAPGSHNLLVAVRSPHGPASDLPRQIYWPPGHMSHRCIVHIRFDSMQSGIYEFAILIDGVPLRTIPFPVTVKLTHEDWVSG